MAKGNEQLLSRVSAANQAQGGQVPAVAKGREVNGMLEKLKPELGKALGRSMDVDRFIRVCITQIRGNEKLMGIVFNNPTSIIGAVMQIAQVGLDPAIPNEAWLIPYGNVAQAQYGYKGLAKLALDSARDAGNPLQVLRADIICENDRYERTLGDHPSVLLQPPAFGSPRGKVLGYVAIARDSSGLVNFFEMTVDDVKEHQRKFSKAINNPKSPFYNGQNFDSYGLKTVLRQLISKHLPMGQKLARVIVHEQKLDLGETEPEVIDVSPTTAEPTAESGEVGTTVGSEAGIKQTESTNEDQERR